MLELTGSLFQTEDMVTIKADRRASVVARHMWKQSGVCHHGPCSNERMMQDGRDRVPGVGV